MAKLEEFFDKMLTVVEHLVNTHVTWNGDLTKDDAKGIIDEAKSFLASQTETTDSTDEPVTNPNEQK